MPPRLYRSWEEGRVTRAQLPKAVSEVWIHNPSPVSSLGQRRWLELFKAAVEEGDGPICRTEETISHGKRVTAAYEHVIEPPTEPMEVWRGAALGSGCGMSWSVHRDCALQFAQSGANLYGRPSGLYKAIVPPHGVLALFGDWREQEIVVNPYAVMRSRVLVAEVSESEESRRRREKLWRVMRHSEAAK